MISRLTGRLVSCSTAPPAAEIEPGALPAAPGGPVAGGGLVYEVLLPGYLAETLADQCLEQPGRTVTLHTRQHLEAVGQGTSFVPRLIGFGSASDRRFFELFTSVKGLGARKALRAMARPPAEIAAAIAAKDAKTLTGLPEIGKRLAETIIAELAGKVDAYLLGPVTELKPSASPKPAPATGPAAEAVAALVSLGQPRAEAERMVELALTKLDRPAETVDDVLAGVFGS